MRLSELALSVHAAEVLRRSLAAGTPHHAHLLIGDDGAQLEALARAAFAALNCQPSGPGDGCGACPSCEAINDPARSYAELLVLAPGREPRPDGGGRKSKKATAKGEAGEERGPARASLGVDAIRTIESFVSLSPVLGRRRGVLLAGAEFLTPPAQNALLKVLEEPPATAILFLLTTNLNSLLLTIRSRCQLHRLPPGRFDPASLTGDDPDLAADADRLLFAADPSDLVEECAALGGERQRAQALLALLELRLHDAQLARAGLAGDQLFDPAWAAAQRDQLARLDPARLAAAAEGLALGRRTRVFNPNPRLVAESALLHLPAKGLPPARAGATDVQS